MSLLIGTTARRRTAPEFPFRVWNWLFAAILVVPAIVNASPILYSAGAMAGAQNLNFAPFLQDFEETGSLPESDSAGPVDAEVSGASSTAFVLNGVLGASAFVTSTSLETNGNSAFGQATFTDTLFLQSSTLGVGTLVDLGFILDLDRVVSDAAFSFGALVGCATANANLSAFNGSNLAGSLNVVDTSCSTDDANNSSGTFQFAIGDAVTVNVLLSAVAAARAGGSASADAANTLLFFANPIGDFFYTTASGNSYLSQVEPPTVPEPASLVLLGTGIAAFAAKLRRRRKHAQ